MNALQVKILERARVWADCWCCETISNGGNCIDDLTSRFTGGRPWRVAYCAMTAWVIYSEACGELSLRPLLPKIPGALRLLQESKKHPVLKDFISQEPTPGAQLYRKSSVQGSRNGSEVTGHIGTVYHVDTTGNRMISFEGNSGQQIRFVTYSLDEVRDPARGFTFINACLAPHQTDFKMVQFVPGYWGLLPNKRVADAPPACRSNPKCAPKKTIV